MFYLAVNKKIKNVYKESVFNSRDSHPVDKIKFPEHFIFFK